MRRNITLGDVSAEQRDELTLDNPVGRDSPGERKREQGRNRSLKRAVPTFVNNIVQTNRPYNIRPGGTRVLPSNRKRRYLIIVNTGADTVFVSFGGESNVSASLPIVAGGNYEPWVTASSEVYIRTAPGFVSTVIVSESFEVSDI